MMRLPPSSKAAAVIQRHGHGNGAYSAGSEFKNWSGARDLNPGPHGPEPLERSVRSESPEAI